MNRDIWKNRNFNNDNPKEYPCPKCNNSLKLLELKNKITPYGKEMEYYNYYYGIQHVFNGFLKCSNTDCGEIISISGECLCDIVTGIEISPVETVEGRFSQYYPKHFYPNLRLIAIPKDISDNIKEQLNLSFSNYFDDLSSCANRVRTAIELILDDVGAPKKRKRNSGAFENFRNLHQRIKHFEKRNKKIATHFLAIKIIGNEGSHIGEVHEEDILDAYEILEQIFELTFIQKGKQITKLAEDIVRGNKPRMKKT